VGERVVMLVNPTSGRGRAASGAPVGAATLRDRGYDVVQVQGVDAEHAVSSLREAIDPPTAAVVACGGDGTVHLAVQVLAGSGIPMGILPLGTGNDSASLFGVPKNPARAAELIANCLASGRSRQVDVGRVVSADGVERRFLAVMSSGFDSMVNERANRMTWPSGQARYLRAILAELRSFKPVPYVMVLDEGTATEHRHEGTGMLVAVGNGTQYGGGMKVCPGALVDDGLLSVTFLDELPTTTFLRVFPTVFKGTHVERPEVHEHTATTVMLDAPGQVAYADGERIGPLPVRVTVEPGALRLLVPDA
jgi:diacylglycerol kinase (ATP)